MRSKAEMENKLFMRSLQILLKHVLLTAHLGHSPQLSVVIVQRLQVLVHVQRVARQAKVKGAQSAYVPKEKVDSLNKHKLTSLNLKKCKHSLKVLLPNELDDNVLLRLQLQQLQRQTEEGRRLDVAAVDAADVAQISALVDHQVGWKRREIIGIER